MVQFNPLIEKKIQSSVMPEEIKKFLNTVLIFELKSSSAGNLRYPYSKELDLEIKRHSEKFKVVANED